MAESSNMNAVATYTPEVITKKLTTDIFTLNARTVTSITDDAKTENPNELVSSAGLIQLREYLQQQITQNGKDILATRILPVISDPIISPNFVYNSGWVHTNFWVDTGRAEFVNYNGNYNDPQATLRIPLGFFNRMGTYFLHVVLRDITVGSKITVVDHNTTSYKVIETAGDHFFTINVLDPSMFYLEFRVSLVPDSGRVYFDAIYCYFIKDNIDEYIEYKTQNIASGGSGFASEAYVDNKVEVTLERANNYTEEKTTILSENITTHIQSTGNVHNATASDIGAADAVHYHNGTDIITSVPLADHVDWAGVLNKPDAYLTGPHAATHTSIGTDPIQISASQITSGTIDLARLPATAIPSEVVVGTLDDMYALTIEQVQLGDSVKIIETNKRYAVIDVNNLDNSLGYSEYNASASWDTILDKPVSFPPAEHQHMIEDITDFPSQLPNPNTLNITIANNDPIEYDGSEMDGVDIILNADTLNVPQNAFNTLIIKNASLSEDTTLLPLETNSTLQLEFGNDVKVSVTTNDETKIITLNINAIIPSEATVTTAGLMSASDKVNVDTITSLFEKDENGNLIFG